MRKKENIFKEEITTENLITQEVLVELIVINHLLTQLGIFMHLKSQGEFQKCLLLSIKEEDTSWIVCKQSLSHHPLTVKDKWKMMFVITQVAGWENPDPTTKW
jgi:hypothetical protein